jgi:hypothetical protein
MHTAPVANFAQFDNQPQTQTPSGFSDNFFTPAPPPQHASPLHPPAEFADFSQANAGMCMLLRISVSV